MAGAGETGNRGTAVKPKRASCICVRSEDGLPGCLAKKRSPVPGKDVSVHGSHDDGVSQVGVQLENSSAQQLWLAWHPGTAVAPGGEGMHKRDEDD